MVTRVKICGIRSLDIARTAIECGASALGFMFYDKSVRNIAPKDARDIVAKLPSFVAKTGVFVDKDIDEIIEIVNNVGLDTIQLHGEYRPYFINELKEYSSLPIIYAVRVDTINESTMVDLHASQAVNAANNILIDKWDDNKYGGTGNQVKIDSDLSDKIREYIRLRVILAGGINSQNVRSIISSLSPYGIDLSSSVESEKGVKSADLIRDFFIALK